MMQSNHMLFKRTKTKSIHNKTGPLTIHEGLKNQHAIREEQTEY